MDLNKIIIEKYIEYAYMEEWLKENGFNGLLPHIDEVIMLVKKVRNIVRENIAMEYEKLYQQGFEDGLAEMQEIMQQ